MTLEEFVKGLQLWLVGRLTDDRGAWEFQGIFVSEGEAQARCEDSTWFVAPVTVGDFVPTTTTDWPYARYPLAPRDPAAWPFLQCDHCGHTESDLGRVTETCDRCHAGVFRMTFLDRTP